MALRAPTAARRSGQPEPHFVLVPLLAQGHMLPMVDMAHLLATRGATVTFITTPVNASRNKSAIDQAKQSDLPIHFVELPFPSSDAGLPDGCENVDLVPTPSLYRPFFHAMSLLKDPLLLHLRDQQQNHHHPPISCLISDYCQPWTMDVANQLQIPRIIFHGPSCFFLLCIRNIRLRGLYGGNEEELFLVPDLPQHQVQVSLRQAPTFLAPPGFEDIRDQALEAEATAAGVVVNTFEELESAFLESYRKSMGKRVWSIGPLCLCHKDDDDDVKSARGGKAAVDEKVITGWLESMERKSVVYVSFGSIARSSYAQIVEIGLGLEAAGRPFVWAVKGVEKSPEVEKWVLEMEERTKGRGMIIRGWAPHMVILNHKAVGGFVMHCGWNLMLEAMAAGVPVATWPHFADQFLNEKLVVEVLGVGVAVGVKVPMRFIGEGVVATREEVRAAIDRLMNGGEEAEERRERARELGEKARAAMDEGGSSYESLRLFIQEFME